jgi:hypothetical protein
LSDQTGRAVIIDPRTTLPMKAFISTWGTTGVFRTLNTGDKWGVHYITGLKVYPNGMVIDPINPDNAWLVSYGTNGIMKTTDGGIHWDRSGFSSDESIYTIAIDPKTPKTLYVGLYRHGLWKSTDGGKNWVHASTSAAADTYFPQNLPNDEPDWP